MACTSQIVDVKQRTYLVPLLLGPLCPGVVAIDRVLSMDQREENIVLMINRIA